MLSTFRPFFMGRVIAVVHDTVEKLNAKEFSEE